MTLDQFLDRLEMVSHRGSDYVARCPAHDDRMPSLSITDGGDRILIFCHAGCPASAIVEAMGLELKALYYETMYSEAFMEGRASVMDQAIAIYDYKNADGSMAYQVLKYHPKGFRQRRLSDMGWVWNMDGVKRIPYNLPELQSAMLQVKHNTPPVQRKVYIVEGEKDVETLRKELYLATCFVGGANKGKFLATYVKYFKGLHVIIIADNDEPGLAYAEEIRDALTGVAASVKVVVPTKGNDITEHLEKGGTMEELEEVDG